MEVALKLTFLACLVQACLSQCLPRIVSHVGPSSNESCPSESVVADNLEQLRSRVNEIIDKELPFLQRAITDGCPGEGWVKVVDFNASACPVGLTKENGTQFCRSTGNVHCVSLYSNYSEGYSHVCGRALGYQVGPLTGFNRYASSVDDNYLDGISVTYGSSPRIHVWSFAVSGNPQSTNRCPCDNSSCDETKQVVKNGTLQNHYFCDSATDEQLAELSKVYSKPLWYEAGCLHNGCCRSSPYFYRELEETTTSNLEVRICQDPTLRMLISVGVAKLELYVR